MINMLVKFQYEVGPGPDGNPVGGYGVTSVSAEREPKTAEEFYEVARAIGRMEHPDLPAQLTSVAVLEVGVLDRIVDDSHEVLEGSIVE